MLTTDPGTPTLAAALAAVAISAAQWLAAHLKGKKRDRSAQTSIARAVADAVADSIGPAMTTQFAAFEERLDNKLDSRDALLRLDITDVRHVVIGVDGKNGVRGRLESLAAQVEKNEERRHKMRNDIAGSIGAVEKEQVEFSSRLRRVETDVGGLIERERSVANEQRLHGTPDRRTGS